MYIKTGKFQQTKLAILGGSYIIPKINFIELYYRRNNGTYFHHDRNVPIEVANIASLACAATAHSTFKQFSLNVKNGETFEGG